MQVLIMCMSGITTTILANKIQKYASSIGEKDIFFPGRLDINNELNTRVDIIVLAPQAKSFYEVMAQKTSAPVLLLDEETFITSDTKEIYNLIVSSVKVSAETVDEDISVSLQLCKEIILNAFVHVIPVLLFGLFAFMLEHVFEIEFLHHVSDAFLSLISMYFVFALGYSYGEVMKKGALFCGMLCLSSTLVLSPVSSSGYINSLFHITDGMIPIDYFGYRYFLCLLIPALLSLCLLYILMKLFHISKIDSFVLHAGNLRIVALTATIFSFFLIIRTLISFFL